MKPGEKSKKAKLEKMTSMLKSGSAFLRIFMLIIAFLGVGGVGSLIASATLSSTASAATVSSISVRGNQSVGADTIRSYLTIKPGKSFSSFDTDESLRQLYATGLFSDVNIAQSGRTLIVTVEENATVNLVLFEGNENIKDEKLAAITQMKSLSIFNADRLESDRERVLTAVRRSGRSTATVTTRLDQLDNNRVNVVYVINEGGRTKIAKIEFIGNNAYGDRRLEDVISHNESNFLSWLKKDDVFDSARLKSDEDRLRQFYYNRGYADFQVISASADLNETENTYTISITVEEGERYRFGTVDIDNALTVVTTEELERQLEVASGDVYSARNVEKSLVALTDHIANTGFAFAEVTPRGERNFDTRTINITFFVDEGPRTYIERIEVVGNTRTRGYVIRREFDISEGDAYNRVMVNKAKRRLEALNFFKAVRVSTRPGSAPDRVIVVVQVIDKPTGELSFGGGYSTSDGPIAEVSLQERNFLGRGQYLKVTVGMGTDTEKYELSFTEPYFLGQRIAAGFDLLHQTQDADFSRSLLYSTTTTLGRLRAGVELTDNLYFTGNYTLKQEKFDPLVSTATVIVPPLSRPTQQLVNTSPYITSSLGYKLTYTDLDNVRMPREGIKATLEQDFAGVGGDAHFIRTKARLTGYYLVSEDQDIILLGSVGAGYIYGLNNNLRVADQFFQGGETIRGFESQGFGPRAIGTGEALGGTTYANATAEVQFPMPGLSRNFGIRGAFFGDVGTLYNTDFAGPGIRDGSALRASVGASIIWNSPFGPLRGDIAHVLNKATYDRTQFFRFGVSTRF